MTCPNCGAAVDADAPTCTTCGATLPGSTPLPPPASPPPASPPPAPPPAPPPPAASTAPVALPSEVRTWAMAAHISAPVLAFLSIGLLFILGPLVVWLIKRNDHPFIDYHGKEAVNFNISLLIYGVALVVLAVPVGLLTFGLAVIPLAILGVAIGIAWLVLSIIAAIKASNGESYRYPFTLRLVT